MPSYFTEELLKANTENGKDWLRKYLHPPSTRGISYNGFPDKSTSPSVHMEYRLTTETLKLASGSTSPDMVILHVPSVLNPLFYAENIASDGLAPNTWKLLLQNNQLASLDAQQQFGRYRLGYLSTTTQYDATAFNNSGMLYTAQIHPTVYTMTIPALTLQWAKQNHPDFVKLMNYCHKRILAQSPEKAKKYLDWCKNIRAKCDAAASDFETEPIDPYIVNFTNQVIQVVKLSRKILQPQDITMLSPKSYTGRSNEGNFVVHQVDSDYNNWCDVRSGKFTDGQSSAGDLMLCAYEWIGSDGTTRVEAFYDGSSNFVTDLQWGQWSWAISYFAGVQAGASGGAAPLLNFKTVIGVEVNPTPRGALNPLAMAPALYDPQAIQTATVIVQSRQDAMPASYNAKGASEKGLGETILSTITGDVKPLMDAVLGDDNTPKITADAANAASEKATVRSDQGAETNSTVKSKVRVNPPPPRPRSRSVNTMMRQMSFNPAPPPRRYYGRPRSRTPSQNRRRTPSRTRKTVVYVNSNRRNLPRKRTPSRNRNNRRRSNSRRR